MAAKEIAPVAGMPAPKGVWSIVTVAKPGRLVFVSGLLARDAAGAMVGVGDMAAQTRQVCENLKTALAAAGATLDDIVRVDCYTTDITKFDDIHRVRREYFKKDPPTSTMVEVTRLTLAEAMIEITAIAVVA